MASPAISEPAESSAVPLETLRGIVHGVDGHPGLTDVIVRLQQAHRKDLIRVERWTSGDLARTRSPGS